MRIKNARPFPCATTLGTQPSGQSFLTIVLKATFVLRSSGEAAFASRDQLPIFLGDQAYQVERSAGLLKFENDMAPFKPRADIVLVGNAYPSTERAASACDVQIEVGSTRKVLRVVGERKWSCPSSTSIPVPVGAIPFASMPLTYDRAFGGTDEHAHVTSQVNPLGRGLIATPSIQSIHGKDLPNLEDPANMIKSWDSHPRPVGCGFFPRGSVPRRSFLGTYDEAWQRTRAPALPDDFRFDFFNAAHPDLQVDGYLVGNERVTLSHVVPAGPPLHFFLPCLQPVLTVKSAAAYDSRVPSTQHEHGPRAVPSRLDTLVFVPDEGHFYVLWRGVLALSRPEEIEQVEEIRVEYEGQLRAARGPQDEASRR